MEPTVLLEVVTRAYNTYSAVKCAYDQLDDTCNRATNLNAAIKDAIKATDPADSSLLTTLKKMARVTDALLNDLENYKNEKKTKNIKSKLKTVIKSSRLPARIDDFNVKLHELFETYRLVMDTQLSKHVRGVHELLQATNGADADEDKAERLLALPAEESPHALDTADVPELIGLLKEEDEKQADKAALKLCARAEADVDAFVNGWIKNLVDSLKNGSSHNTTTSGTGRRVPGLNLTSSMVLRVLYRLALVAKFEIAMVQAGAMAHVSTLLRNAPMDNARAALCAMLTRLLVQADHKQQLLEDVPLLEAVVALVGKGSPTEKLHAISVVGCVAKDHSKGAEEIAQLKTIPLLIKALHHDKTRLAALRALWSLSSLPGNSGAVVDEGGVGVIVGCLSKTHSGEIRQLAASIVARLAQNAAHAQLIGEAGAIPSLVKLLVLGTTQEQRNSAVWALAELTANKDNAIKILGKSQVVEMLLAAFDSDDVVQRANAGRCLEHLAQFAPNKALLERQLRLRCLLRLLDAGATDQRQTAARVMQFFVQDASMWEVAVKKDAIQKLLGLVQHHPSTQKAVDALCAFVDGDDSEEEEKDDREEAAGKTCRGQILAAGGVDILTKILDDCADNQPANDLSQDKSDAFASVGKLLLRIAVSKHVLEQVASRGVDIALRALDEGSQSMQLRAVAFLAEFTQKCLGSNVCEQEINKCAAKFNQLLHEASCDGLAVYAVHWLLSTDRSILSWMFPARRVGLFSLPVWRILIQPSDDPELEKLRGEALALMLKSAAFFYINIPWGFPRM